MPDSSKVSFNLPEIKEAIGRKEKGSMISRDFPLIVMEGDVLRRILIKGGRLSEFPEGGRNRRKNKIKNLFKPKLAL
jgi:hypothetical protein